MRNWSVIGADRDTGDMRRVVIVAQDEGQASERANAQGILVSEVCVFNHATAHAPTPAAPTATMRPGGSINWRRATGLAWSFGVLPLAITVLYLTTIRPLQLKLMATQNKLRDVTSRVEAQARNHAELVDTVNHNAEVANRTTKALADDLESLTRTVNHNAEVANFNNRLR